MSGIYYKILQKIDGLRQTKRLSKRAHLRLRGKEGGLEDAEHSKKHVTLLNIIVISKTGTKSGCISIGFCCLPSNGKGQKRMLV
jgi:hypothetical protein